MSLLERQYDDALIATGRVPVEARDEPGKCSRCKVTLNVLRTKVRYGKTLAHGHFAANETIYGCPVCKAQHRNKELAQLIPPCGEIGYDVMVFIGCQRHIHNRQAEEIRADLLKKYKLPISLAEISHLQARFCVYLRHLHETMAPQIKAHLARTGGYVMLIDATGENGRGTIFLIYDGWRKWVLGAWKIDTEQAQAILPKLQATEARFGVPVALVRDMGGGNTEAALIFVGDRLIRIRACHLHFLKDIGKDLMKDAHDELRTLLRRFKIQAKLRQQTRAHGRKIGAKLVTEAQKTMVAWMEHSGPKPLAKGAHGLAIVRAIAQWVLDYKKAGTEAGFPFDRPMLEFYRRATDALGCVEAQISRTSPDKSVMRALRSLRKALLPVADDPSFRVNAEKLNLCVKLFDELRDTLRLGAKPKPDAKSPRQQLKELEKMKTALDAFASLLEARRPEAGPGKAKDMRKAIDTILEHLERHGDYLWGHAVTLPDGSILVIPRTNVLIEIFFGLAKRGERRRSGRKNLGRDLEQMPAEAFLAKNLKDKEYLTLVCGKHGSLAAAFAALDEGYSTPLPLRLKRAAPKKEDAETIGSSLPKGDRKIVRDKRLGMRIHAEARRRIPGRRVAARRGARL